MYSHRLKRCKQATLPNSLLCVSYLKIVILLELKSYYTCQLNSMRMDVPPNFAYSLPCKMVSKAALKPTNAAYKLLLGDFVYL